VKIRYAIALGALALGYGIGIPPLAMTTAYGAQQKKPAISEEASAALIRMGQSLRSAEQLSFQARTIRVYGDANGQPLHIFHSLNVAAHRPNRLLVNVSGDDGTSKLVFDGKTAFIYSAAQNKYASIPVPEGTIEAMMKEAMGRLGVDFPLADFLSEAPSKAFLTGVTSGSVVNTITIDGSPYLHLLFSQPPGIELELWLAKNDQSLPRRLIVTYRDLPGQPNFIAEFSEWNLAARLPDGDFAFQPPAGAEQMQLKPAAAQPTPAKGKRR
jgi:hypothetical protein